MGTQQDRLKTLRLFLTVEHPCSYLPGRQACNLVADPQAVDARLYSQLAQLGFRRSGEHVYRPHCAGCQECLSLRIDALAFRPNRAQRRIWQRNEDLRVTGRRAAFDPQHYQLYARYLQSRHRDGGMDDCTPESYLSFITSRWSDTLLYEFCQGDKLLMVAVVDQMQDGLSAVYTFFDPHLPARSLGNYAILWQIHEARRQGLGWIYLGYWVRNCRKMNYKGNFKPFQVFLGGRWLNMPD